MSKGTVVTFYSFKGGVGRSFLLANVGTLLAQWGYRILCVDWDLEAPGLGHYFADRITPSPKGGLLEFVEDYKEGKGGDWESYLSAVQIPAATHPLSLMLAGRADETYVERVQRVNWTRLYKERNFGQFLETMRDGWRDRYDLILIDSRTGITDIGGICTVHLPDIIVFLFTANKQSLDGAIDIVNRAMKQRNRLPFDRAGLLALPVPSRLSSREERELTEQWLRIFAERLGPLYESWSHKDVKHLELLDLTKIPYFSYWSFGEHLPVIEERQTDPEGISYNITTIAALLAHRLVDTVRLVSARDLYVANARVLERPSDLPHANYDVFISYSRGDQDYARELSDSLKGMDVAEQGHGLRIFLDQDVLKPGAPLQSALNEAIRRSRHKVFLVSSRIGKWQEMELEAAVREGVSNRSQGLILPVTLPGSDMSKMPSILRQFRVLDGTSAPVTSVAKEIAEIIRGSEPQA